MTSGANPLNFNIYKNYAYTNIWGDTIGTNTVKSVGTGSTQNIIAYGRFPVQTTPIPGTYSDTDVVTVTF